jgi:hypothetical protein
VPFQYAHAPRVTRQPPAAELRRDAEPDGAARYRNLRAGLVAGLLLIKVAESFTLSARARHPPVPRSGLVLVCLDNFEADGKRLDSAEQLRKYLEIASTGFGGTNIRECGAQKRAQEATNAIRSVATKKRMQAG